MKKSNDQIMLDRLAEAAREGRISRRSFMNYSMAAGMTATTATGLWTKAAAAQPKSGGTFRVGIHDGNTSDTHDPGTYLTIMMITMAHTHRSYLTMINSDETLGPDLADRMVGQRRRVGMDVQAERERDLPLRQEDDGRRRHRVDEPPPRRRHRPRRRNRCWPT